LDLLLFLAAYRMFSPTSELGIRRLLPGATLGAVGWAALKIAGAAYVSGQAEDANAIYGAFGGIIALLLLLYLAGRLYLYGAELTAVLAERDQGLLISPEVHGVPLADEKDLAETPSSAEGEGRAAVHDRTSTDRRPPAGRRSDGRPVLQDVAAGRASYVATSNDTAVHRDAPATVPVLGDSFGAAVRDRSEVDRRSDVRSSVPVRRLQQEGDDAGARGGEDRDVRAMAAYGFAVAAAVTAWRLARGGRDRRGASPRTA
jgi:hypothetical protein